MRPAFGIGLLLALLPATGPAYAQLPARLEIAYDLLRNGSKIAQITGRLEASGESYRLTETWGGSGLYALLGSAKRTSEGALTAAGPRPREFADERSGRDTARASFDWGAKTMTLRYKGRSRSEPIPPHAQDRLSFVLALSLAPPGTKSMDFQLVDGRGVSYHVYQFAGRERLVTRAGEFDTVKVVRAKDDERTEIWLAAEHGYMPVRMLAIDKGRARYDQVAKRISTF